MKKLSLLSANLSFIVLMTFSCSVAQAANKNEFSLGTGYGSWYYFLVTDNAQILSPTGSMFFSYRYIRKRVSWGVTLGAEQVCVRHSVSRHSMFLGYDEDDFTFVTCSADMRVRYAKAKLKSGTSIDIYGIASLGMTIMQKSPADEPDGARISGEFPLIPAVQLMPLGVRVGRRLGGFFEMGFGYKGIVHAGINLRIADKPQKIVP